MALRLLEVYINREREKDLKALLKDLPLLDIWFDRLSEGQTITRLLLPAGQTEEVLDLLENNFTGQEGFRVVILSPEATIPRPEEKEEEQAEEQAAKTPERISMEELYQKMADVSVPSTKYVLMSVIATVVAAIGLLSDDMAVIIGSMVISPLLGPYMALSLATTLADSKLAFKSAATNAAGFFIVLLISVGIGFFIGADPGLTQIAARSNVSHYFIFLALASGVAGAYSLTSDVPETLVGVLVAVAMLPPLVTSGLLFGSGHWLIGAGALLLFFVNVVCINLSGVATFFAQGIRPKRWWEAQKASKAVKLAVALWVILLVLLAVLIYVEQRLRAGY